MRLSAIVDRFVWKKKTKGKAGIRWDKVAENVWKEIEGNKNEIMSIEDVGEYKTKVGDTIELRAMKSLRQKVEEEEHLEIYGGLREGIGMKNILTWPTRLRKKLKITILDRSRPTRKKEEIYQ